MIDSIIDTHFWGRDQSVLSGNMTFFHSAACDEEQFLATAKHVPYSQSGVRMPLFVIFLSTFWITWNSEINNSTI